MDSFQAHYADIRDPSQQPRVVALPRHEGLVTFSGITDRTELAAVAGRLMVDPAAPRRRPGRRHHDHRYPDRWSGLRGVHRCRADPAH